MLAGELGEDTLYKRRKAAQKARREILGLDVPPLIEEIKGPRYTLVILDLDGTLVDSTLDIASSVNDVRLINKLKPLRVDEIKKHIGWGVAHLLKNAIPESRDLVALGEQFLECYKARLVETTKLMPDAVEVLSTLVEAGIRLAVATNKPEALAKELLRRLGIHFLFVDIAGGDRYPEKKPHPRPILELHQRLGRGRESLVVGDSIVDAQAAHAAGLPACLVHYQIKKPEAQSESLRFLDGLGDLIGVCRVPDLPDKSAPKADRKPA